MQQIPRIAIEAGEQRRIYQVLDDVLTLGDGLEADIRISGAGLRHLHLKVVRVEGGFRLECIEPDGAFVFEGKPHRQLTLKHGDRVQLDEVELTFLIDAPEPRRRKRSEADGAAADGRAAPSRRVERRLARRRGMPPWALASCLLVSLVAVAALVVRGLGVGSGGPQPDDYLELARQQWERGAPGQALGTLELARTAGAGDRREIDGLEGRIRAGLQQRVDEVVIQNGRTDLKSMANVEERYLIPDPSHRPAARELMRQVDAWEAMYSEEARRLPELAAIGRQVHRFRDRYGEVAAMDEADQADDVLFAARWRMRLRPRRLLEALDMVDAWLAEHGDHPEVRECQEECREAAVRMVDAQLISIRILMSRDDLEGARSKMAEVAPLARRFDRGAEVDRLLERLEPR